MCKFIRINKTGVQCSNVFFQKWLIKSKANESNSDSDPHESLLPDPNLESTPENVKSTQAVNSAVLSAIKSAGKRKRGKYSNYDSPHRAKIAKYACEHGNASAVRHFQKYCVNQLMKVL